MHNKVIIVIHRNGFTDIYWAHNGALTKRYNSPKRVHRFLSTVIGGRGHQQNIEVYKTIWNTEVYADVSERMIQRELINAMLSIELHKEVR